MSQVPYPLRYMARLKHVEYEETGQVSYCLNVTSQMRKCLVPKYVEYEVTSWLNTGFMLENVEYRMTSQASSQVSKGLIPKHIEYIVVRLVKVWFHTETCGVCTETGRVQGE